MKPQYRRARSYTFLWVGTFILGNVIGVGVGFSLARKIGGLAAVLSAVIFAVSLWVGAILTKWKVRGRRVDVGRFLKSQGYTFELKPTAESFGPFAFIKEWGGWEEWMANSELKWVAQNGHRLLMEREFVTGTGDPYVENNWTLGYVLHEDCARLKGLRLVRAKPGKRDAPTGDQAFDRAWAALRKGDEPIERELSAAVRLALSRSPLEESWCFWDGWACCKYEGFLDAKNHALFLQHVDEVVGAIRK
jgi:hypothetical protein